MAASQKNQFLSPHHTLKCGACWNPLMQNSKEGPETWECVSCFKKEMANNENVRTYLGCSSRSCFACGETDKSFVSAQLCHHNQFVCTTCYKSFAFLPIKVDKKNKKKCETANCSNGAKFVTKEAKPICKGCIDLAVNILAQACPSESCFVCGTTIPNHKSRLYTWATEPRSIFCSLHCIRIVTINTPCRDCDCDEMATMELPSPMENLIEAAEQWGFTVPVYPPGHGPIGQ